MKFELPYDEQDAQRYDDAMQAAIDRTEALESQELIIEIESELERARRRAPVTEQKCCLNPASFTRISSLERDLDTGTFTGDYYRCHCGSRISEEDFAAIVAYEDSKVIALPEMRETRPFLRPKKGAA